MDSQFARAFKAKVNTFSDGLAADLGGVAALPGAAADAVFEFLLEAACQSQSEEASMLGARYLLGLPRFWAIERIKEVLDDPSYFTDDYAFRRLVDLCEGFESAWPRKTSPGRELLGLVIAKGEQSADPDVREEALDYAKRSNRYPAPPTVIDRRKVLRPSQKLNAVEVGSFACEPA